MLFARKCFGRSHGASFVVRWPWKRYASTRSNNDSSLHYATVSSQLHKVEPKVDINSIPLTQPLPGLSKVVYADRADIVPFDTTLTTLENGLRVATEPHYGDYCTLGVAIDAGARYEAGYPSGTSHFVEKLAFSGSSSFPREKMFSLLERCCALIDCQSTKDTFIYASSCHVDGAEDMLSLIADAVHRPLITSEELETVRQVIKFENKDRNSKPECEPLLTDWIHEVAFNSNTVGFPKYCPPENVDIITRQHLFSYMKQFHEPSRIVVAGIGVDHNLLVSASKRLFDSLETVWARDSSLLLSNEPPVDNSIAQYTGGEKRVSKDLSSVALGPTPYPDLAHLVLGFESCGYKDEDFLAFSVLLSLMGGGGSFSAGGPGKGMYTRLYLDVLNRYHYIFNATAYNHAYKDTGLFCIQASCPPKKLEELSRVISYQFLRLEDLVERTELERAKTQLKSQLMMNLEVRPVMFEDLARQVLGHGYRRKPQEYIEKIEEISTGDIVRAAQRMLSQPPSVVGYGNIEKLPAYEYFNRAFAKRDLREFYALNFKF